MIIKSAELETVCGPTSRLPKNTLPEAAFLGRSNVGKSSLINTLLNRKTLARTSSKPGKTQTINFYKVNNEFYLVDLPGYGYAKASKESREKWTKMTDKYLRTSGQLKVVFLLMDIRRSPSDADRKIFEMIVSAGYEPVIIATKTDKIKRNQLAKQLKAIREGLFESFMEKTEKKSEGIVISFSSVDKTGRAKILECIAECAAL